MTDTRVACEHCGATVEAHARFCPACGAVVSAPADSLSATTPFPASSRPPTIPAGRSGKGMKAQMMDQLRDATLGDYEILAELGSGGMATVFLAHDLQLDRRVAIKLMHPALVSGEGMVERFILEARTAAGLSHPNIIPIYAVKVQEDLLFFVMKFVEGRPLDSIIKAEAPLKADMVREIVSQVAAALGYAHHRGVIHRDIKPANIMISTDGHPVLTDFGIAKVAAKQGLTLTGVTIGTPTYMSPEQCNALPLTGASDQYSLGVMAYEMLTGKPPFDAPSVMTIMMKHINEQPRPLHGTVADCPADLAASIDRMLAKNPADRFPEMDEVARALQAPTTTAENMVRTQLVQYALAGSNREVLKRVSTPRSPIPSALLRSRTKVSPPARPARRGMLIGGIALTAIAGVLAVTQPWKADEPGSDQVLVSDPASPDPATSAAAQTESTSATLPPPDSEPANNTLDSPTATPPAVPPSRPPVSTQRQPLAPAKVATVRIAGPTALSLGGSGTLSVEPRDATGQVVSAQRATWTSSAPEVVSVSSTGQLDARREGRAVISATVDGVSQSVTVTVSPEAVSSVTLSPAALTLDAGENGTLSARVVGPSGGVLNRQIDWSSSAPAVASVTSSGSVSAHGPGSAVITAASGGHQASATVTVRAAAPSEAELRAQVASTIQAYASALESGNIARVRQLYPAMTTESERQLRQTLPAMQNLQIRLTVGQVQLHDGSATAAVSGSWVFTTDNQRNTLPADNTYRLERRGTGWVITDIR